MEKLKAGERRNEYHQWFESIEELMSELPAMSGRNYTNQRILSMQRRSAGGRDYSWLGHTGGALQQYVYIKNGWPEYTEAVRGAASMIEADLDLSTVEAMTMDVRRRKRMRRDHGDVLHMSRVWSGDLEHAWDKPERTPRRAPSQRYATVYVDLCASAFQDARNGVWRAATAMKISDLFTAAGIATEIWIGDSSHEAYPQAKYDAKFSWRAVRVKEFMQPLNVDRLASLTSVGTFRVLGFEMIAAAPYDTYSGFGCPYNIGLPWPLRERQERGERVIRIGECWNIGQAKREIAAVAAALANKEVEA